MVYICLFMQRITNELKIEFFETPNHLVIMTRALFQILIFQSNNT